ncbi:MAG: DnaB-like helicase C-terminal domain-containing protein [Hyphomicrobium sp.]
MSELAEEAVVGGAIMLEGPWPIHLVELQEDDFYIGDHAKIWESIMAVRGRNEPSDIVHVYREIRREHSVQLGIRMTELAENSPTCCNIDHWAALIIDDSRKRHARAAAQSALQSAGASLTADEAIEAMQDAMRSVRPAVSTSGPQLIKKGIMGTLDELMLERRDPDHARLLRTGIPDLDTALHLRASELTICAGRPSMGKSALAMNIAAFASFGEKGGGVAVFSLEMSTDNLVRRVMAGEGRLKVPLMDAVGGTALEGACKRMMQMRLYTDDRAALSVDQMSAAARKVPDLRLVIVDYLQLAKTNDKLERQDLRVGHVAEQLKNLAKDHKCHVIALSQLNRKVEERTPPIPVLSDLRDSGKLEEHADNILMLYRPEYYTNSSGDPLGEPGFAQIFIKKQRNGELATVPARWLKTAQRFMPW